ncbi:hypothetical protein LSO9J_130014 [Candidatus Liberibacter solanacearum]
MATNVYYIHKELYGLIFFCIYNNLNKIEHLIGIIHQTIHSHIYIESNNEHTFEILGF